MSGIVFRAFKKIVHTAEEGLQDGVVRQIAGGHWVVESKGGGEKYLFYNERFENPHRGLGSLEEWNVFDKEKNRLCFMVQVYTTCIGTPPVYGAVPQNCNEPGPYYREGHSVKFVPQTKSHLMLADDGKIVLRTGPCSRDEFTTVDLPDGVAGMATNIVASEEAGDLAAAAEAPGDHA